MSIPREQWGLDYNRAVKTSPILGTVKRHPQCKNAIHARDTGRTEMRLNDTMTQKLIPIVQTSKSGGT